MMGKEGALFMGYDYTAYRYFLPDQFEMLKSQFQSIHGTVSLSLEFERATQGPLSRMLLEIPPASYYIHLTSIEKKCAGLIVLSASLAYRLIRRQLGETTALPQLSASLLPVEIAFIRKELHQFLPLLTMPGCGEGIISIESITTTYQSPSLHKRDVTWSWASYSTSNSQESAQLLYGIPNRNVDIAITEPKKSSLKQSEVLRKSIHAATVTVGACLGSAWVNQDQLASLIPGTVLSLVEKTDAPLEVQVNLQPCFFGKMGVKGAKKAVQVTSPF